VIVVDVVDALLVSLEAEIGDGTAERPDLDGVVETGGSEGLGVFRVDGESHDVVRVALEDLSSVRVSKRPLQHRRDSPGRNAIPSPSPNT
jgi:hypothetical protein